jgi:hypothetical protein
LIFKSLKNVINRILTVITRKKKRGDDFKDYRYPMW